MQNVHGFINRECQRYYMRNINDVTNGEYQCITNRECLWYYKYRMSIMLQIKNVNDVYNMYRECQWYCKTDNVNDITNREYQ